MNFNDGRIYEGNWLNGKINGNGKMKYSNGGEYDGEWVNGQMNGKGILIFFRW